MGLLESAGGAAAGAADKMAGDGSPLGGLVDDIAGKLGVGDGGTGGGTPYYYPRDALNDKIGQPQQMFFKSQAIGSGGTDENRGNRPLPLEFIHFGKIHRDLSDTFAGKGPPSHGVGCRDALLREGQLLYGFAASSRAVVAENMQGAIGAPLATVGSLLGSGKKSGEVAPAQFDKIMIAIETANDAINVEAIDYPGLHKAGVDLHTARADLAALCAAAFDPKGGGGGGLPSLPIPGALGGIGAVGGFIADLPKYLFKAQDAYKAMYQASRQEYEAGIEDACRAFSIEAIKDGRTPTYRIWFDKDEAAQAPPPPPPPPKTYDDNPLGKVEKAADDAAAAKDKAIDKATKAQESLTDWLQTAGAKTRPGSDALSAAFAVFSGGVRWNEPRTDPKNRSKIVTAPDLIATALGAGTGIDPLPGPVATVVKEIAKASLASLQMVYTNLLLAGGNGDMKPLVLLSVRDTLSSLLVDLAFKLAGQDAPGENKKQEGDGKLGSVTMGKPELLNKGAELVQKFLSGQARHLDVIIAYVVDDLVNELECARTVANDNDAMTMEVLLGRLPMLLARQVRNTLFPLFNLLLDAFGLGDSVGQTVWNPVRDRIKMVGDAANDVKKKKDDALAAADQARQSGKNIDDQVGKLQDNSFNFMDPLGSAGALGQKATDLENAAKQGKRDILDKAEGKQPAVPGQPDSDKKPPDGNAPLSGKRIAAGNAAMPSKSDVDGVKKVVVGSEAA